jgi:hypothetical protein
MSWVAPVAVPVRARQKPRPPDTSRPVTINGRTYPSLTAASHSLGCSITKVYRMIGESK